MGFASGFTGGVTLTLGLAYLTVLTHERNRQAQAAHLRSQSRILNSLLDPLTLPSPKSRAELAREERGAFAETAKDRWNEEVENAVRWVQQTDWTELRERAESTVSKLLSSQSAENAKEESVGIAEAVKATTGETLASAKQALSQAEGMALSSTKEKLGEAHDKSAGYRDAAKAKAGRATAETKYGAQEVADSIMNSGETVDAARDAVRDVLSKGIEKGKEAIGKATAAVGSAKEKVAAKVKLSDGSSDIETALRQRYEKSDALNKTPDEVLAERYTPSEMRDSTVLRGV